MARTVSEIYNSILAEKATMSSLNGLTTPTGVNQAVVLLNQLSSTSRVAIWRLWAWVIAFIAYVMEVQWDTAKAELTSLADEAFIGSDKWLVQKVKDAQLGDIPTVSDDFKVTYPVIDPAKRYITKATVGRENGLVVVKVAAGESGSLRVLTAPELTYGQAWLSAIQFVAPKAVMVSRAADKLKLTIKIYYSGLFSSTAVSAAVADAINAYLADTGDADGFISIQALTDRIQAVAGVKDVEIDSISGRPASSASWSEFTSQRGYSPDAGFATYQAGESTITMIAA